MYHPKPVISEISGEKSDSPTGPTENLLITICWGFGPGKDGGTYIVNIDEPKACSEHAHKHSMTTGLHLCFICILQTSTSKFIASSRSRPTAWWPGSYVANVTQGGPNHFFAMNEPSAVPFFQYHKKTIPSSLSVISIASFTEFFLYEHTKIS